MTYLLDTNVCIYTIKRRPRSVVEKIRSLPIEEICISTITVAELEHGVTKSQHRDTNRVALLEFLTPFRILDFDQGAARNYGEIRSALELKGTTIGPLDLLIGAHARSQNLTLVTNNTKEFRRISGLRLENWV